MAKSLKETLRGVVGLALVGVVAVWYFSDTKPDTAIGRIKSSWPADQQNLVYAVEMARNDYKAGKNDMDRGATRPARARAICNAIRAGEVRDWVGSVALLSTNGDGLGVLAVRVGPEVKVGTWNNSLSDLSYKTLISPNSSVFAVARTMKIGSLVKFSGTLFPDSVDCIREQSMTLAGSVTEPEFVFRFSSLQPLN
jgi:hypothetical protein